MSDLQQDRQQQIAAARESFSGKTLTESQFREAWAISGIIHNEIHRSGSFREKLTDYAHAFSRSEKFDAMRGETILRDIYQGRYSQTMNQTREGLVEREKNLSLTAETQSQALRSADSVLVMIKDGPTQPFYKAYDAAAVDLSGSLNITQTCAKALIKDAYKAAHGDAADLYEAGKELEEAYHKPVREAEIAARKQNNLENRSQQHSQARSMV